MRALGALLLLCAGCTDTWSLGIRASDAALVEDLAVAVADLARSSGDGGPSDGAADALGALLPAACARLACQPPGSEGDVSLSSADLSGCHAYGILHIDVVTVAGRAPDGGSFSACAESIFINGTLSADGKGDEGSQGLGAGGRCGAGGSHGGLGSDPGMCTSGGTYGDQDQPRTFGSGGGGIGGIGGTGGHGGGVVELSAGSISITGTVSADGSDGAGASGGGGSGGSVLVWADRLDGSGKLSARGGDGFGLAGGGGGGGRIAVHAVSSTASLQLDVRGGDTPNGFGAGATGSTVQAP